MRGLGFGQAFFPRRPTDASRVAASVSNKLTSNIQSLQYLSTLFVTFTQTRLLSLSFPAFLFCKLERATFVYLEISGCLETTFLVFEGTNHLSPHLFTVPQNNPPVLVPNQKSTSLQYFVHQHPSNCNFSIFAS
jgi:hypothetical protein